MHGEHTDSGWGRLRPFYQHGDYIAAACDTGWSAKLFADHATTYLGDYPTGLLLGVNFTSKQGVNRFRAAAY